MAITGTVSPEDLVALTNALDDLCRKLGLANGDPGREQLGRRIMNLLETGALSGDDLKRVLSQALP